jgi:dTDP-4-amino-4,6-dideoxygalactose transaminase
VKLKHLPDWIEKRRGIANLYHGGLSDLQELKLPPPPQSDNSFFDVYQN